MNSCLGRLRSGRDSVPEPPHRAALVTIDPVKISPTLDIPDSEIELRFMRASGPGGQHVNRTESAVELRFDIASSPSLPEPLRARLLARRDRRLTMEGVMVIQAQRFRSQEQNREDARGRLAAFVAAGLKVPKKRVATRPTRASKERRIEGKKRRGGVKQGRGRVQGDDG